MPANKQNTTTIEEDDDNDLYLTFINVDKDNKLNAYLNSLRIIREINFFFVFTWKYFYNLLIYSLIFFYGKVANII